MQKRKTTGGPIQSNYYPITSAVATHDDSIGITILTRQALGAGSGKERKPGDYVR